MGRVVWTEGQVISVETRQGIFTLAQMARDPFIFFFDRFNEQPLWAEDALEDAGVVFCVSVTRQFLQQSLIEVQTVRPRSDLQIPDQWIQPAPKWTRRWIARGTDLERQAYLPSGASLVRKDVMGHTGGPYRHPSGAHDEVLEPSILACDEERVERYEMTSMGVFPTLNERLYLCHLLGRRVAPWADIILGRPLPPAYADYLDLVAPRY